MTKINNLEKDGKVITVILRKQGALPLLKALAARGVTRISFAFARGHDLDDHATVKGLPVEEEKEIVTVIAKDAEEGEELFDFIFETAQMNRVDGGIMYMSKLNVASMFLLPEIESAVNNQGAKQGSSKEERPPDVRA